MIQTINSRPARAILRLPIQNKDEIIPSGVLNKTPTSGALTMVDGNSFTAAAGWLNLVHG
jgi:hypothetical protein